MSETKRHFQKLTMAARCVGMLAGVGVGLVAFYLAFVGSYAHDFRMQVLEEAPWVLYLLPPVVLILINFLRLKFFLGTEGTGIPQTIAALEMDDDDERSKILSLRILLGKMLLTTLGLFSGASMGREGPTVHAGACLVYFTRKIVSFPPYFIQRGLILAGGAAGIAAAFNAPVAGIVFSIEEIGRSFDKRNLGLVTVVVLVACVVCIVTFGNYWFYGTVDVSLGEWSVWVFIPVIAIAMGGLGGLFSACIVKAYPIVSSAMRKHPVLIPLGIGVLIGGLGWLSNGATLGTGFTQAQSMLVHQERMEWYYPILRVIATGLTLLSGIPGGLFDPTLSAGACFGQWFTGLIHQFEWASGVEPQLVMLIAMACFFAGVVQSPVTAVVILVEMTNSVHATLPMMAGAIIAYAVSRRICTCSIYVSLASTYLSEKRGAELRDA
ncbi:MAG: chloride channel protein [Phycisphaerales bacterium]|nr:chloride channel protein [Phycisphaerales bacterium]